MPAECPSCGLVATRRYDVFNVGRISDAPDEPVASAPPDAEIPGVRMENVTIENCGTGIDLEDSVLHGRNVRLIGNKKAISAKRSSIKLDPFEIA